MKFDPFDTILSSKSKKNKANAELKPYFENTNDTLGLYKNPSLRSEEDSDSEEDEENRPKGKALLKKIYGGACWKGYEQFGMKEKNGRQVPNCIPAPRSKSIKRERKGGKKGECKSCQLPRVVKNYQKIVEHLQEHQAEGVGDPKDAKQSAELKKEIVGITAGGLTPASKVKRTDPLYKVSNPKEVQKRAKDIYGKGAVVYKSSRPAKKYQILNREGKWVYFGDAKRGDFTQHLDEGRRHSYLSRALGIRGKWRDDPYSPNSLAILLLW